MWEVLSASVRGSNHIRTGTPNQDAVATIPGGGSSQRLVLSVSDGHGAATYVRSDIGARIATEVMLDFGQRFVDQAEAESLASLKSIAEDWMPRQLVRTWHERVLEDARQRDASNAAESADDEESAPEEVTTPEMYGATLLGAVLTPDVMVCWQLGDGDIVIVTHDGRLSAPLTPESRPIGVETDSLANRSAWRRLRVHWVPLHTEVPALVLLASDGLANSFASDAGFHQFASDMLARLRTDGIAEVRQRLPKWLARATEYSGDDTSLACAWQATAS